MFLISVLCVCCSLFEETFPKGHDHTQIPQENYEYIAIFGDIQYLMDSDKKVVVYRNSIDWIAEQADSGVVFDCILHTGDITNKNLESQYKRYYNATKDIAKQIPYYSIIGDHDYKWDGIYINSRDSTFFSKYNDFPLSNANIIVEFEKGRKENVFYKNIVHGQVLNILCLEFGPRTEVVEWANEYVACHPEEKFVVMTHEYLESGGGLRTENLKSKTRLRHTTLTTPKQLWEKFIKCNDNIVCVLCGHVGSLYAITFEENDFGRQVAQIQHNTQSEKYRFDNWLMLWEFSEDSQCANVSIINTNTGDYYGGNPSLFTFQYRDSVSKSESVEFSYTKANSNTDIPRKGRRIKTQ